MLEAIRTPEIFIRKRKEEIDRALLLASNAYVTKMAQIEEFLPPSEAHELALKVATSIYNDHMNTVNILNPAFDTVITNNLKRHNGSVEYNNTVQAIGNNDRSFIKQMGKEEQEKFLKK
jgi:hypothetical protein